MATTKKKKDKAATIDELRSMLVEIKRRLVELGGAGDDAAEGDDLEIVKGEALDIDDIDFSDDADEGDELRADGTAEDLINKAFDDAADGGDFNPLKKGDEDEDEEEEREKNSSDPLRRRGRRQGIEVGAGRRAARGTTQKGAR